MKKVWLILPLIILIALSACGQQKENASAQGTFNEKDLIFEINGEKFELRTPAAPLIAALGDDYTVDSSPSCLYIGEDKQYYYENVFIFTYPMEGEDTIDQISISGGDYTTTKGIGIGSSFEQMEEQYGKEWFDIDGECAYVVSGDPDDFSSKKLYFEIKSGVVASFTYYGAANAS